MTIRVDSNVYKTKDLAEAAFLLTSDKTLNSVIREGNTCWFVFNNKEICLELINKFWFGDEVIPARKFYESIQILKNKIFSFN